MKARKLVLTAVVIAFASLLIAASSARSEEIPRITKEELRNLLGNSELIVIDVRQDSDWEKSNAKIKGAVRETPDEATFWMKKYPKDKTLVFYCS